MPSLRRSHALLCLLAMLPAQVTAIDAAFAIGPACTPLRNAAALHFFDAGCAPTTRCLAANGERSRRGVDQPLVAAARRVAWTVALFLPQLRVITHSDGQATPSWSATLFDNAVDWAWRSNSFSARGVDSDRIDAFVAAAIGTLHPGDRAIPAIELSPPNDARLLTPISGLGMFDLESAAHRRIPGDIMPPPSGPAASIRMSPADAPEIGIYGWELAPPWPQPGPPLQRQSNGHGAGVWTTSPFESFTHDLLDSHEDSAETLSHIQLELLLQVWRDHLQPYQSHDHPPDVRAIATAASNAARNVVRAITLWPLARENCVARTVLLAVRFRGDIVAVLRGSIGRFGPNSAEIHAIATPLRNLLPLPHEPPLPAGYSVNAVRGAVPYAVQRFVQHVRSAGATRLHAVIADDHDEPSPPPLPLEPPPADER